MAESADDSFGPSGTADTGGIVEASPVAARVAAATRDSLAASGIAGRDLAELGALIAGQLDLSRSRVLETM